MKKILKKMAVGIVSFVIVIGMMIPTMASNTSDTYISSFSVPLSTAFIVYHSPREKQDSTPLYIELTSLVYGSIKAQARGMTYTAWMSGETPSTLNTANQTANGDGNAVYNVTLSVGIDYSVRSFIYEYGYAYATWGFKGYNITQPEVVSGWWSPDSSYTHHLAY